MKSFCIILAVITLLAGLKAAWEWYKASKVTIVPDWSVEPGDSQLSEMGWLAATMKAINTSSDLNKTAAIWTALAVCLGAISGFVSIFQN